MRFFILFFKISRLFILNMFEVWKWLIVNRKEKSTNCYHSKGTFHCIFWTIYTSKKERNNLDYLSGFFSLSFAWFQDLEMNPAMLNPLLLNTGVCSSVMRNGVIEKANHWEKRGEQNNTGGGKRGGNKEFSVQICTSCKDWGVIKGVPDLNLFFI